MLDFRSNLYKGEWLDLVFADRNKTYGAYELRQHYSSRLILALFIASSLFVSAVAGPLVYKQLFKSDTRVDQPYDLPDEPSVDVILAPKEPPKSVAKAAAPPAAAEPIKTKKFVTFKPVPPDQVVEEAPTVKELTTAAIGSENVDGKLTNPGENIDILPVGPAGGDGKDGTEVSNLPFEIVEVMPSFPGGESAFGKFLGKNIRYPSAASEASIHGKVYVSFIVERDGTLTDITVERGIGYGCDEEVIRVMKRAPKWTPGIQNGKPVRVKYTVPVAFNISE